MSNWMPSEEKEDVGVEIWAKIAAKIAKKGPGAWHMRRIVAILDLNS
jgi:hypothetical protein